MATSPKSTFFVAFITLVFVGTTDSSCTGLCVHGLSTRHINYTGFYYSHHPCLCQKGYTGKYCETPIFGCLNGGTILPNGTCRCPENHEGTRCEFELCLNGIPSHEVYGHSESVSPCVCDAGFTGVHCDLHISSPCGTHGQLYSGREHEGCQCDERYEGRYCDHLKDCVHGIDDNGRCDCDEDWEGVRCDKISCKYGTPVKNNSECICENYFGGRHCDVCTELFEGVDCTFTGNF